MIPARLFSLAALATLALFGQPAFEAASVKPSEAPKAGNYDSSANTRPDNLEFKNVTLRDILVDAFQIKDYQLIGPDWLNSARFDIVAKAPLHTSDKQLMPMLRTLVTDRFRLQVHREKRDLPCFALVVAKGGPNLKEVPPGDSSLNSTSHNGGGELTATKAGMESFAEWLSQEVERPVLNETGLGASYDFTLKYVKESAAGIADTPEHPVITRAILEQLGLRLEKRTLPAEVVVIDHVEKTPIEN